jgi:hypothetical protein
MARCLVQVSFVLLIFFPLVLQAAEPDQSSITERDVIDTVEDTVEIDLVTNRSPFRLNWEVDLPIIVSGMVNAGAPRYMGIDFDRNLSRLDPGEINKIDRLALGNWSTSADSISDVLLSSQVILPFVLDFVDVMSSDSSDGLEGFAKDSLILVETLAVNCMAFNLAKFTIRRPRPYAYSSRYQPDQDHGINASLSFFLPAHRPFL